jgi:hypothetical protein
LYRIYFIYLANLIDLIVGVLMPLYTHLHNPIADSFIGGNILPRENHHPSMSKYQALMIYFGIRRLTNRLSRPSTAIFFCRRLIAYSLSTLDGVDRVISRIYNNLLYYFTAGENLKKTGLFPGDNEFYPRFENYNNFWLIKTPGKPHISGCC